MKLAPDEELIFRTRPHLVGLVGPVLLLLLVAATTGVAIASLPTDLVTIVLGVAGTLALLVFVLPLLRWSSTVVTLTSRRLILTTGLLRRGSRVVQLHGVAENTLHRSIGQRLIGAGTLELWTTAGQCLRVRSLPRARWVAEAIDELIADLGPVDGPEPWEVDEP